jgi:KUP system potassium uptake protein
MTHVVQEQVILLTFVTRTVPYVPTDARVTIRDIGEGFTRIVVATGFAEVPSAPRALATAQAQGFPVDPDKVTYFLNSVLLAVTDRPGLAKWRKWLFVTMSRNALHAATFLGVPSDRVMEIGTQVEL